MSEQRRRCYVRSNGFGERGWFHEWFKRGKSLYALVELDNGQCNAYEVSGCYSLEFVNDEPEPPLWEQAGREIATWAQAFKEKHPDSHFFSWGDPALIVKKYMEQAGVKV